MKLIGKGLFSKVYKVSEKQVLVKTDDPVKECFALFLSNDYDIFPDYEITENNNEYLCEYYPKVKSLKNELLPEHYAIYKELRALNIDRSGNRHMYYNKWREQFETVSNETYREGLIEALDELTNYGSDICFEISPRNVAVKDGKLILLDVFFIQSAADERRQRKSKKHMYAY